MQTGLLRGAEVRAGGADRLMGFLGVRALVAVVARLGGEEVLAVEPVDALPRGGDGLSGEVHRVGAHVGDEPALV